MNIRSVPSAVLVLRGPSAISVLFCRETKKWPSQKHIILSNICNEQNATPSVSDFLMSRRMGFTHGRHQRNAGHPP